MIKVQGVNIFPGQIEELMKSVPGLSSEYQIVIEHTDGKDIMTLRVEVETGADSQRVASAIIAAFKAKIGIKIECETLEIGGLPRSEKKSKRVFDYREA